MFFNLINVVQAAEQKWQPITLNVPIAGIDKVDNFGSYFQLWYSFAIGAVGVLATVMIMWGGFKWLTSRGNSGVISESKQIIWSAIIGLVLAFLSYTILYLINPQLTTIGLPTLKTAEIDVFDSPGWTQENKSTGGSGSSSTPCNNSGSAVVGNYDFTRYAENCNHIPAVRKYYDQMSGKINTAADAQRFIDQFAPNSPITGEMVMNAGADPAVIIAEMIQDSSLGTAGWATRTNNPGNVGNWGTQNNSMPTTSTRNDAEGYTQERQTINGTPTYSQRTYDTWQHGVGAVAIWLNKHKVK